jgi:uncharacterized protein YecE (DUF72 family)
MPSKKTSARTLAPTPHPTPDHTPDHTVTRARQAAPRIRAGIGGWNYEPWRGLFYPAGLAHSRELHYASRQVSAIEINSTYYGTQKPATFAKWRSDTPDDFVFSLKASRYATNRRVLAEAGESIQRFIGSGIEELGDKLGPIVWQFAPTKQFDAADFGAFLGLLPERVGTCALRHALDVRHASFAVPEFVKLARQHCAAIVCTDAEKFPLLADLTSDFTYARLMRSEAHIDTGYTAQALHRWAERAAVWAAGGTPQDLPRQAASAPAKKPRDVFVYFIDGAKERAPAAARALLERLAAGAPS